MVHDRSHLNGQHSADKHTVEQGYGVNTLLVHAGVPSDRPHGSAIMPIYQNVTFKPDPAAEAPFFYSRMDNPNLRLLGEKLARLEGADAALVFSSGMAAISSCMLALLKPGDHFITQKTLYGGTYSVFYEELQRFNISLTAVDSSDASSWEAAVQSNTKVIYVESIGNPLLNVPDLKGIVAFAKKHNLTSVVDSTFAPPVNFRPAAIGIDCVLHSATKYANGHSDVCAGILSSRADIIDKVRHKIEQYGGCLDPHAAFLLQRGLATLKLRVDQQNKNGLAVAQYLSTHPKVKKVYYPGLKGSKGHEFAKELFTGFGGVLSAELRGGAEASEIFQNALKIPFMAVSLGGIESLVCTPAKSTHAILGPDGRKAAGVTDSLVRLALGIEDTEDLVQDVSQALDSIPEELVAKD